jgi:hypothetical protein
MSAELATNDVAVTVEVQSVLLLDEARQLAAAIASAAPGTEVAIDFRRVLNCEAAALACLAHALRSARCHVVLLGISGHFSKLLGYLGVPSDRHDTAC